VTAGPDSASPRAPRPSAASSRPTGGVPPWEITDSFLAVPPAPTGTARAGAPDPVGEPTPGPVGGLAGAGAAEAGDSTESFAAVDPEAAQGSFPRGRPRGSNESFPAVRSRTDADAFRLFPPVRGASNDPSASPATDGED
jgi:hypothetical protein